MAEGKAEVVGVAGRTLMDEWGERGGGGLVGGERRAEERVEGVREEEGEDASECPCAGGCRLRIEEMEDEVEVRPRGPCEERR